MSEENLIISILSFILNSALFSGFIIPQIQKLKEIKDKLIKFNLSYVKDTHYLVQDKDLKKDIKELHSIFHTYEIRSYELNKLIICFYGSLIIAAIAIFAIIFCPLYSELIFVLHTILQLVLLFIALKIYAISPQKIHEAAYLVGEMGINPYAIIRALALHLNISSDKPLSEKLKSDDPLTISLSFKARIFGFRYVLLIYDEKNNLYNISFGPISLKTNILQHILPPTILDGEYNRIPIGQFPFNNYEIGKKFIIDTFIFIPFFENDENSPLFGRSSFQRTDTSLILSTGGAYIEEKYYDNLVCKGIGTQLLSIKAKKSEFISNVIEKYSEEIRKSKKITHYQDLNGSLET